MWKTYIASTTEGFNKQNITYKYINAYASFSILFVVAFEKRLPNNIIFIYTYIYIYIIYDGSECELNSWPDCSVGTQL